MRIPDFFIVGAPKCGTTALYTYLEMHPKVFMSTVKEPHFFSTDIPHMRGRISSFEQYFGLFRNARSDQVCGEASTSYLLSECALKEILCANPRAKLIAMIRNPLDMVVAFHQQQINGFLENERNFEVAWHLSDARSKGLHVPPKCKEPRRINYKAVGRLGEQVERLMAVAPKEQVYIIMFDDFVSDTRSAYCGVLRFLGLPPIEVNHFPLVNARNEHRVPAVSKFLMRPPFPLNYMKRSIKQILPREARRIGNRVRRLTQKPREKSQISPGTRTQMIAEFADDIALLGRLLNRDLSHWHADH
jgi:hypothetical protein